MTGQTLTGKTIKGTLYGVGVGPGDPELITLKAHRLISAAKHIAYPAAEGVPGFARGIVAPYIRSDAQEIIISMPMVAARFPAQEVYDRAATGIRALLDAGEDVVVLCEGDPFFYGSFMYLFARLHDAYPVRVIPGVSSVMACASAAAMPLVSRNDAFLVLTGPMPDESLTLGLQQADAIAIMKVGRHLPRLIERIEEAGLINQAVYVERASLPNQRIERLNDLQHKPGLAHAPYFSMILIHRRGHAYG